MRAPSSLQPGLNRQFTGPEAHSLARGCPCRPRRMDAGERLRQRTGARPRPPIRPPIRPPLAYPGTVVYYDDVKEVTAEEGGELAAHEEITAKYTP